MVNCGTSLIEVVRKVRRSHRRTGEKGQNAKVKLADGEGIEWSLLVYREEGGLLR